MDRAIAKEVPLLHRSLAAGLAQQPTAIRSRGISFFALTDCQGLKMSWLLDFGKEVMRHVARVAQVYRENVYVGCHEWRAAV
jgi:hypothetical protein